MTTESHRDRNFPKVLKEVGQLGNDKHRLMLRVIRYQHPLIGESRAMLDIRRYHKDKKNDDGTLYTGFGHGVSLGIKDLESLKANLDDVIKFIQESDTSKVSTKG